MRNQSINQSSGKGTHLPLNKRRKAKLRARKRILTDNCETFHCTFCLATFNTKGNWIRHEASVLCCQKPGFVLRMVRSRDSMGAASIAEIQRMLLPVRSLVWMLAGIKM
jgi:hypothetical protein